MSSLEAPWNLSPIGAETANSDKGDEAKIWMGFTWLSRVDGLDPLQVSGHGCINFPKKGSLKTLLTVNLMGEMTYFFPLEFFYRSY